MTFLHRSWRLALAIGLLLVAGATVAPVLAQEGAVSIAGLAFQPSTITVAVGDTVTWTVTESIGAQHSVTSGKPGGADVGKEFDSGFGLQNNGESYKFTFQKAGTYDYFCQVHPEMVGQVVVTAAGGEGGEAHAPIPPERKLLGGVILAVTLVVLFVAAWFWRRMNPAQP